MIYSPVTYNAMRVCYNAFRDVYDGLGAPYIFHAFTVAESMDDEISTSAALLHDVVENTEMTFEDLKKEGIPEYVIRPLILLTCDSGTPYMQYIENLSDDRIARKVKIADLAHNMDKNRFCRPMTDGEKRKQILYQRAMDYLLSKEGTKH